jgi:hypothetical protein
MPDTPDMIGRRRFRGARAVAIAGRGRWPALLAAALFLCPVHPAAADVTIEGDARAMTVTVADISRQEVTDEIARRFGLQVSGPVLGDAPVSGRFRGDLGDVLGGILAGNNFLIVYEGGQPSRLLLSERGQESALPLDPAMRSLQPNAGIAPGVPVEGGYGDGMDGQGQLVDPALDGQGQFVDPAVDGMPLESGPPPKPQL